jgi:hypothetical protein
LTFPEGVVVTLVTVFVTMHVVPKTFVAQPSLRTTFAPPGAAAATPASVSAPTTTASASASLPIVDLLR